MNERNIPIEQWDDAPAPEIWDVAISDSNEAVREISEERVGAIQDLSEHDQGI
jgi:hypothetical protein